MSVNYFSPISYFILILFWPKSHAILRTLFPYNTSLIGYLVSPISFGLMHLHGLLFFCQSTFRTSRRGEINTFIQWWPELGSNLRSDNFERNVDPMTCSFCNRLVRIYPEYSVHFSRNRIVLQMIKYLFNYVPHPIFYKYFILHSLIPWMRTIIRLFEHQMTGWEIGRSLTCVTT